MHAYVHTVGKHIKHTMPANHMCIYIPRYIHTCIQWQNTSSTSYLQTICIHRYPDMYIHAYIYANHTHTYIHTYIHTVARHIKPKLPATRPPYKLATTATGSGGKTHTQIRRKQQCHKHRTAPFIGHLHNYT